MIGDMGFSVMALLVSNMLSSSESLKSVKSESVLAGGVLVAYWRAAEAD
jgi:hypothetical protein